MQILFLVEDNEKSWQEASARLAFILQYDKSLSQNFILTDRKYISNSIANKCLIVNTNIITKKVLLSPSLVVNLFNQETQEDIEKYFRVKWLNSQFAFWKTRDTGKNNFFLSTSINENKTLTCLSYTTNLESLEIALLENSVEDNKYIGLIEQAITECFADMNFYKYWKLNPTNKILKNRSLVFRVNYEIIKENADYSIHISSLTLVDLFELFDLNVEYIYEYLNALLKFRLDYYVEQVTLRKYIFKLCEEQGIDFEPSLLRTFVLLKDNKIGLARPFFGGVNDLKGIDTINDKHLTNVILNEKGFKTNLSYEYMLGELNDKEAIENIPLAYPLVLKPTNQKKGYGVVTNILNAEKMLFSVQELLALGDIEPVLIEEFFIGMTYRVLVVGAEVIAVLKFMPTYIIGNGVLSIKELIDSKNLLLRSRIRVNDALELGILNDGYNYSTVLKDKHKYILSHNSHATLGGQGTNVTDIFKEKYKKIACDVSACLGLTHTGVDMNINAKGDYRILEVNCAPALSSHVYPKYGTSIDTYTQVLNAYFSHTDLDKEENKYLSELMKYHK
ncbi:MAG: hypothetical protein Q9M43_01740 [Sulfurimonas sp.]|nr:hypothetical protein [Sulfurimonas sp.]